MAGTNKGASPRLLCALARFGLTLDESHGADAPAVSTSSAFGASLATECARPGRITLITGPSGSGKSTLLREIESGLRAGGVRCERAEPGALGDSRVIDLVPGEVDSALCALSTAGLADATLLARRASKLSEGERWRLSLAVALARAGDRGVVIADEFCSMLDRPTAARLCVSVRRWVERAGVALVCATAHEDVAGMLGAERVVRLGESGAWGARSHAGSIGKIREAREGVRPWHPEIGVGAIGDYLALSGSHYRAGRPATVCRVLAAREEGRVVGALVVSHPVLNGPWRKVAWPGEFEQREPRERARRLNERVRCISRVVVDPAWRGRGVASALVRAYLAAPMTERTEAVASMGLVSGLFRAAGMREVEMPTSARNARLLGALERAGLSAWTLSDPGGCVEMLREKGEKFEEDMERELNIWADAARGTRALKGARIEELMGIAAKGLAPRAVFVGEARSTGAPLGLEECEWHHRGLTPTARN